MTNYRVLLLGTYCVSGTIFGSLVGYKNYNTSINIEKTYGDVWPKELAKKRFKKSLWKGIRWGIAIPFSVPLSFYDLNRAYILKSDLQMIRSIEHQRFNSLNLYQDRKS